MKQPLNIDIFGLGQPQPSPVHGNVLVAQPGSEDDCFKRAVVQLIEHDKQEGSMGLIVNKQSGFVLGDVLPHFAQVGHDIPLWMGGPVGLQQLFFLHGLGSLLIPGSLQVARGLWFGGDYEAMKDYILSGGITTGVLKCIVGYSGWTAGQLQAEVDHHEWAVLKGTDAPLVLRPAQEPLWQQAVTSLGPSYARWLNWPLDIHSN